MPPTNPLTPLAPADRVRVEVALIEAALSLLRQQAQETRKEVRPVAKKKPQTGIAA